MSPKKNVLIIDDEPAVRDMYAQKLIAAGYAVSQADDGITGLQEAIRERPDLILLDVRMTYLNGFEMIKKLRADKDWGANVPVIFLTNISPNEEAEMQTITATTPAYYLIKSNTTPENLLSKVREVLQG